MLSAQLSFCCNSKEIGAKVHLILSNTSLKSLWNNIKMNSSAGFQSNQLFHYRTGRQNHKPKGVECRWNPPLFSFYPSNCWMDFVFDEKCRKRKSLCKGMHWLSSNRPHFTRMIFWAFLNIWLFFYGQRNLSLQLLFQWKKKIGGFICTSLT